MKKTLQEKRVEIIHKIMKQEKYKNGIKLSDLYIELQKDEKFDEVFRNRNQPLSNVKHDTRSLIAHQAPNCGSFDGGRHKNFYKVDDKIYTYLGNPNFSNDNSGKIQSNNAEEEKKSENDINSSNEHQANLTSNKTNTTSSKNNTISKKLKELDDMVKHLKKHGYKIKEAEYFALKRIRLNQPNFRKLLIKEFKLCPIKHIDMQELLIASHIVDYKDCKNENEAADPENGILLSANIDKLFDAKLISFSHIDGKIIISKKLSKKTLEQVGISENCSIKKYLINKEKRRHYLYERNKKYKFY